MGARNDQVGEGDVPLSPVVRLVAASPEPVAERRHRVGVEPVHAGIGTLFGRAVRRGHPVKGWVLPGEERGTARCAGRRSGVMAMELDSP